MDRHSECRIRRTAKPASAHFYSSRVVLLAIFIAGFVFLFDFARGAEIDENFILTSSEVHAIPREEIFARKEHSSESETAVESFSLDFEYPVRTRLEIISGTVKWHDDVDIGRPRLLRFRRADKAAVTQGGSLIDYMSSYYAQRKAIMDKYNSQQREISERLEKTKSSIAAKQRLKVSKTKLQPDIENATRTTGQDRNVVFPPSVTPPYAESESTTELPSTGSSSFENEIVENNNDSFSDNFYSHQTLNETVTTPITEGRRPDADVYHFNETGFMELENSTQSSPQQNVSFSYFYTTTLPTFENNDDAENEENSEFNFPPQDEVDLNNNLTEESLGMGTGRSRDNETLIIDLGGRLTDNPWRNDSTSAELDKMFLWDVDAAGEERLQRSNGTAGFSSRSSEIPLENGNSIIVSDDSQSLSLPPNGTSVRVETSPGVQVTKNVTNIQSSTTMYRNSTHEIVEVDGVVTKVRRIDEAEVIGRQAGEGNWTNGNASASGEAYGPHQGAQESEWCEECPHDYRWGECEGTLFYQHNIFLRNRGPSAIDAIFGMEVQGPVDVTCVEALRFNQTRGIVTLHSGGPGSDFAKLRIRGFQGEGFSYIMKVWGVNNEDRRP